MFAAQVTGTLSRPVEKKEAKFGTAFTFSIETRNKKGEVSYINCIQYSECHEAPKGSLVFVSGELDIGQYKGKPSINMLSRSFEVLAKSDEKPQAEESIDDMPF